MEKKEMIIQIIKKKELSKLPLIDVKKAFSKFENEEVSDKEKIRLTRELLNKVFWPFRSDKLLSIKNKDEEWILRKHQSSRERLGYYEELYKKLNIGETNVIDLGCGINGFSYKYFGKSINYLGIEAVGQLVDLMNYYFKTKELSAVAVHDSLFNLSKIKLYIHQVKGKKFIFLFKVLDNLEMLERDYSKKLLMEIVGLVDRVVVSFATRSMISRKKFSAKRNWIIDFIKENFKVLDDFEIGDEKYIIFSK